MNTKKAGDPKLLTAAEWWSQCPQHLQKQQHADLMVWTYLLIWVGAFD